MDAALTQRIARFTPPWLRYMVTLSEAAKTGEGWVIASGDDIALWDTDGGAVLPMWPTKELAAEAVNDGGEATAVGVGEIVDRLLPFLAESDASISLFPNFDDDMLIEPAAVTEDLADFINKPHDVVAQLTEAPTELVYDEWALLESPGVEDERPEGWAPSTAPHLSGDRYADAVAFATASGVLWLLDDAEEDAVVGMVLDDRPALALWATQAQAADYAERVGSEVAPRSVSVDALVTGWLLIAYGGDWAVALSPDESTAIFVEPVHFALDIAEACAAR